MKTNIALSLTGVVLVGLLSGCSGSAGAATPSVPTVTSTPTQAASADPAAGEDEAAGEDAAQADNPILSFGQTQSWKYDSDGDGVRLDSDPDFLSISVSAPQEYKASESAMSDSSLSAVKFDITVTNTGTQLYDPSMVSATLQSGGAESEQIFDSANGINGSPATSLLPGDTVTFPIAFSVQDPSQLVLEVTPAYPLSVIFTNRV